MKKYFLFSLVAGMILFLSGCVSSAPPVINLQPQINVESSQSGNGKSIVLQVTDGRPSNDFSSAKILSSQNVAEIVKAQLSQGLQSKGFTLVPIQSSTPLNHLNVNILAINYRVMNNLASSNSESFASAQVKVLTSTGLFTKTYNASHYSDSYLDAMMSNPSDMVNQTVAQLMNNMLNDAQLMKALAK